MNVLVTAASRYDSTAQIADVIGHALRRYGLDVDVKDPDDVDTVDQYDAVVLGSAVYAGHWLDSACSFAQIFGRELASKRVWLFSSGPLGYPPWPAGHAVDVESVQRAIRPEGHHVFAGKLDRHKLSFVEKAVTLALRAPEGDYREWPEIERWARGIARALIR